MRRFSSNITDPELFVLFREAGEQYEPECSSEEIEMQWVKLQTELAERMKSAVRNTRIVWLERWTILIILLLTFLFLDGPRVRFGNAETEKTGRAAGHPSWEAPMGNEWRKGVLKIEGGQTGGKRVEGRIGDERHAGERQTDIPVEMRGWSELTTAMASTKTMAAPPPTVKRPGSIHRDTTREKKAQPRFTKWSIGLVGGSDWSMVEGSPGGRLGYEAGVLLQYRFARRWSVESGLLVADKIYAARPADYHSPVTYIGLFNVNAKCRVFDIPVNIRYDLLQRGSHQVFVSAGLSSYWMQEEQYEYQYTTAGAPQKSNRTLFNQNRHILSIANVSAGYEHSWNNFSFQVNPYMKLPLTGIGFGRVRLLSTGIQFSAKVGF